jgi:hypothetical protein
MLFREAIYYHQTDLRAKFVGFIEVDESYFGAKRQRGFHGKLKRGRGTLKQPVFGIFQSERYQVCRRVNILRDYPDDKTKIYS